MTQLGGNVETPATVNRSTVDSTTADTTLDRRPVHALVLFLAAVLIPTGILFRPPDRPAENNSGGNTIQIEINAASEREISLVPGIGPVLARRIVENRSRFGDFDSIEAVGRVHGVGEKTLERIAEICVVDEFGPAIANEGQPREQIAARTR